MSKSWIYQWTRAMWNTKTQDIQFDNPQLDYAASGRFRQRGVQPGDTLFIANIQKGQVCLGGFIKVDNIVDKYTAARLLNREESELWQADDYAIATQDHICNFRPKTYFPDILFDELWLKDKKLGQRHPKRNKNGAVDPQTLRSLPELVHGEDKKLMNLLGF